MQVQVKEIMNVPVITVDVDDKIGLIAQSLTKNRIHAVPVTSDGKVVGIITEKDFFIKNSASGYLPAYIDFFKKTKFDKIVPKAKQKKVQALLNLKARDIMSAPCISVHPESTIKEVLDLFKQTQFNSLPVTDGKGKVVGIITVTDVLELFRLGKVMLLPF